MKKLVGLSILLMSLGAAAQTPHKPSINGGVHNDHFNFDHASNYNTDSQILNQVQNDRTAQPLVVFWPKAGIIRPIENPLASGDVDYNKSYCPEAQLGTDPRATLKYGLSDMEKPAGVYIIAETAKTAQQNPPAPRALMNSEIVTSIKGEPVKLEFSSRRIENVYVEYSFEFAQGKANFALNVQPGLFKYFADSGVQPQSGASEILKFGKLPLREQIPDFKAYSIFKPVDSKSFVKIPAKSVQIRRQLLFLVDQDMQVVASGFVTLHVPAE